jgi:hypothetical protein
VTSERGEDLILAAEETWKRENFKMHEEMRFDMFA